MQKIIKTKDIVDTNNVKDFTIREFVHSIHNTWYFSILLDIQFRILYPSSAQYSYLFTSEEERDKAFKDAQKLNNDIGLVIESLNHAQDTAKILKCRNF